MSILHGRVAMRSFLSAQVDKVIDYVVNQAEHHKKQSFREEYLNFLRLYNIEYDDRYVLSD